MNLKDKIKSDSQELKQTEIKSEKDSSTNIMQKSNQQSKELELLEKQSEALRKVTEQRDKLVMEGRTEDQTKIQNLSSEISSLKSVITELKTELSSTQKINQSLTQSNDELRNNNGLLLKDEQKELQDTLRDTKALVVKNQNIYDQKEADLRKDFSNKIKVANDRADEVEQRCAKDNAAASKARSQAESYKAEQLHLLNNQKAEIDKLSDQKIATTIQQLTRDNKISKEKHKKSYAREYAVKETWHIFILIFCVVWSIIQGASSNYFRGEIAELFSWVSGYAKDCFTNIRTWTVDVANLTNGISNDTVSMILYWILWVLVGLILVILFYVVPLVIIVGGSWMYFKSKLFDRANQWIMVGSSIFFIALASEMFYTPPINLLVIWFIVQVAVPLLRYIIIPVICSLFDKYQHMDSEERRNFHCNIMMIVIVIAGFFFLIWTMQSCSADLSRMSH